jgi:hypothetical protein
VEHVPIAQDRVQMLKARVAEQFPAIDIASEAHERLFAVCLHKDPVSLQQFVYRASSLPVG